MFDGLRDGRKAADGVSAVIGAGPRAARSWRGQAGHGRGSASHPEGAAHRNQNYRQKGQIPGKPSETSNCKLTLVLRREDFALCEQHSERSLQQQGINVLNAAVNFISLI